MKDVPIKFRREEYVSGMVPKLRHILAVKRDALTMLLRGEFVSNMVPK